MNQVEIECCLTEIMSENEFLNDKNPITYMIFLDRYGYRLNQIQVQNTRDLIDKLKDEMNAYNDMNLRRFNNPLCRIPIDQREQYFEEHKNELL